MVEVTTYFLQNEHGDGLFLTPVLRNIITTWETEYFSLLVFLRVFEV